MITVELRRPATTPEGDPVLAGRIVVSDSGTVSADPDVEQLLRLSFPYRVEGELVTMTVERDPVTWARNLHKALRTGYLVPVVLEEPLDV